MFLCTFFHLSWVANACSRCRLKLMFKVQTESKVHKIAASSKLQRSKHYERHLLLSQGIPDYGSSVAPDRPPEGQFKAASCSVAWLFANIVYIVQEKGCGRINPKCSHQATSVSCELIN